LTPEKQNDIFYCQRIATLTPVAGKTKLTYNDYLKTTDDKRYELIQGELIMIPSPVTYLKVHGISSLPLRIKKLIRRTDFPGQLLAVFTG